MKKKIMLLFVCGTLMFAIAGCEASQDVDTSEETKEESEEAATEEIEEEEINQDESEPVDEAKIEIESHEVNSDVDGFFKVKYKIKNIGDEVVTFYGISIKELDEEGDILNDYYSYNKNEIKTELNPEQSVYLELTFSEEDGIAKIESDEVVLYDEDGSIQYIPLPETYIVEIETTDVNTEEEEETTVETEDLSEESGETSTFIAQGHTSLFNFMSACLENGCEYYNPNNNNGTVAATAEYNGSNYNISYIVQDQRVYSVTIFAGNEDNVNTDDYKNCVAAFAKSLNSSLENETALNLIDQAIENPGEQIIDSDTLFRYVSSDYAMTISY